MFSRYKPGTDRRMLLSTNDFIIIDEGGKNSAEKR
jgi:hypothetical protein